MRSIHGSLIAAAAIFAAACGGGGLQPASVASLTSAQAAVRAATEMGAERVPRAALHLKFANEQIESAQKLLEDGDDEVATRVLTRAEADAEVALALARNESASREVTEAETRLAASRRAAEEEGQ